MHRRTHHHSTDTNPTPTSSSTLDLAMLVDVISSRRRALASSIGAMLTKSTPNALLSPRTVANQIRRLRRHEKTTLSQRHASSAHFVSDADKDTLKVLCTKLLSFCNSRDIATQDAAAKEITALSINDSLVRATFQLCKLKDASSPSTSFGAASLPDPIEIEDIHNRWSDFLGDRVFRGRDEESVQSCCDALKGTLRASSLAVEYLSYALALNPRERDLKFLLQIWNHFLDNLAADPNDSGWSKMNTCITNILSTSKPLNDFLSPTHLAKLAPFLILNANQVSIIFTTFFAVPELIFHRLGNSTAVHVSVSEVEFAYPPVRGWTWAHVSSYCLPFLDAFSDFVQHDHSKEIFGADLLPADIHDLPSYIDRFGRWTPLEHTVFADKTWIGLYRVADYALSNYPLGGGLPHRSGLPAPCSKNLLSLVETSVQLSVFNSHIKSPTDEALGAFYVANSIDIDRYCKIAVHNAYWSEPAKMYALSSNWRLPNLNCIRVQNGLYELASIPLFDNVPYLRRFRINGAYIITSDDPPEPPSVILKHLQETRFQDNDFSVDTMLLDGHTLVCLRVDREQLPFDCAGHHPLLAGYSSGKKPYYVAAVRIDLRWYFTCVTDGASTANYTDEMSETRVTDEFFVLALRHDPPLTSDLRHPRGALDPTGPVFWLRFWPEKDPSYYEPEDGRLRDDDRLLEAFLNEVFAYVNLDRSILNGFTEYCL